MKILIVGEGERAFAGLVEAVASGLPFPDRRFIRHISYQSVVGVSAKLATVISSRGF